MKKYFSLIALSLAMLSCENPSQSGSVLPEYSSPKILNNDGNPLLDFNFNADPTAYVENDKTATESKGTWTVQ